ncbi:MAG: type II toxin-antitoxin system VapB family antitoxin [Deltaproteobacteria bacterium]|nr:type II toxin-antitoxin system VapB family antitoxin [Deltaproteobacteria bacterium]
MRTTLDLPADLMKEAQEILGYKSKTDVVIYSIREVIRRKKMEKLKALAGKIDLKIDIAASRRRPGSAKDPYRIAREYAKRR